MQFVSLNITFVLDYNLKVITGSHLKEGKFDHVNNESVFDYDEDDIQTIIVKPGQMIIFHQKLIHAGGDSLVSNANGSTEMTFPGFDEQISHLYLHSYILVHDSNEKQEIPTEDTTYYVSLND